MCLRRIHKCKKKHELCLKKTKKCQSLLSCVSFYLVPLLLYLLLRDSSVLNCLPGMNKWKKGEKNNALTHGGKANRRERKRGGQRRVEKTGISDAKRGMKERDG